MKVKLSSEGLIENLHLRTKINRYMVSSPLIEATRMKSTEVQTSPMLASGAKLLPCVIYAC